MAIHLRIGPGERMNPTDHYTDDFSERCRSTVERAFLLRR